MGRSGAASLLFFLIQFIEVVMLAETKKKNLPSRSEIPVEYTWNLESIYANDDLWNEEYQELKQLIPQLSQFKGKLGESAEQLLAAIKFSEDLFMRLEKLYVYAHMRYDQDTTNSHYQSFDARAKSLLTEAASTFSYFEPEFLAISDEKIQSFLEENEELALYSHKFERMRKTRPHILSEQEENLLAQAADVLRSSSNTFGMLNNADLKFPTIRDEDGNEVEVTHGRFSQFLRSRDRRVRKDAFLAVYQTYGQLKNTFASTLSGTIKKHNFIASVRRYQSARHAALSSNHIPEKVYDQLVDTVNEYLPLLHRYVSLRKRALNLDEIHMYDLYTPLVPDVEYKITYDEAKEVLIESMHLLGEEYQTILRKAFEERWVDVYENKGKRSGAYSSGSYLTKPYILLNWQNLLEDLFTLAHEFGHSVHSYYTRKHQPYVYGDYPIFLAEVASTCNEELLQHYLMNKTQDRNMRLYLINHYLESFRATVFRQTMFAEFEHLIHQKAQAGEPLTAENLTEIYYNLNKKYFGDEIIVDEEIGLEWARIPHFYYNYYVYQYATGNSAAVALSKQIIEEGKPAVDRYIQFLKSGNSDYPIELLKKAGVDMTTSEPIRAALQTFGEKLDEFEKLLFND